MPSQKLRPVQKSAPGLKDLIRTVGLPITSFTVSEEKKRCENVKNNKKKRSENDQLVNWSFSVLFYIFSLSPPPPPPPPRP